MIGARQIMPRPKINLSSPDYNWFVYQRETFSTTAPVGEYQYGLYINDAKYIFLCMKDGSLTDGSSSVQFGNGAGGYSTIYLAEDGPLYDAPFSTLYLPTTISDGLFCAIIY
jgi:hypothetical protein